MKSIDLLTPPECAQLLRVAVKTLYRWVAEERVPHIKLNGKLLFSREKIEQLLASKEKAVNEVFAKQVNLR